MVFPVADLFFMNSSYGKMASAPEKYGMIWRDGRVAEGACLENMFGSHQRGFESHSLRHPIYDLPVLLYNRELEVTNEYGEVPEWLNGLAC
jgi:hypothetical protein